MVSGSAALPEPVLSEWESITGTLESYTLGLCFSKLFMYMSDPFHGKGIFLSLI